MRRMLIGILMLVWMIHAAAAQDHRVVVGVGMAAKRSFAVTGFKGDAGAAGMVAQVLKNDLELSGHFRIGTAETAEFIQQGTVRVERNHGIIECSVILRSTQQVVLSRKYEGSEQDLRRMVHRLTDDIVETITGQKGIAQTKIAFVWTVDGKKELAVMDYDGHNVRQLTQDKSLSARPRWSPDGKQIVYTSYMNRFPDVIEINLFTGQRRRLAAYPGLNSGAVYSPDGNSIALTLSKDGNPELYVMDASGGGLQRLTQTKGAESSPTWSPDGQYIAYVSDMAGTPQIYRIHRSGGEPERLTFSPSYNTEPDWSRPPATGQLQPMLAVTSRVGGKFQIGVYNSSTRAVEPKVADDADNEDPSWAPNGRHLVFTKTRGGRTRLCLLDVLTGEVVQLPELKQGGASQPAWGP